MKEWKDLHPRTKHYYASFAKQGVRPVLESIAPGQGEELWNYLKNSSITGLGNSDNDCDEDEEITPNTFSDNTLRNLIDAYNNAQSSKEILSIFAQNFKRKQLKDLIPGLTDFRIKEARKHCKEHGPGTAVPTAPVHRFFLNEDKVDDFFKVHNKRHDFTRHSIRYFQTETRKWSGTSDFKANTKIDPSSNHRTVLDDL